MFVKVGLLSDIENFAKFLGDAFRIPWQKVEPKCVTGLLNKKLCRRQTDVGQSVDLPPLIYRSRVFDSNTVS
jgi:hypothetical protein